MMSLLGRPAADIAFFKYGSSNSTYRVELVVSGRIAATAPLPWDASGFSCAIAEKSFVNDVVESAGTFPELLDELDALAPLLLLVVVLDELPHAASATLALTASMATRALPLSKCMEPPPGLLAGIRRRDGGCLATPVFRVGSQPYGDARKRPVNACEDLLSAD
jgi:hypothetical protein